MINQINSIVKEANAAFQIYQNVSGADKKIFLYSIAEELEISGEEICKTASEETNLPVVRFQGELARTCSQLRLFGDIAGEGSWVNAVIDTADEARKPLRKPDMRKMLIPLGPVVVFGASNFPLAYSTPGGDTASALAAGCPVIVKGHPAHPNTSQLTAEAIERAVEKCSLPKGIFQHITSSSFEVGKWLVQHPGVTGVGFTGSLQGGRALHQYAQNREVPIPVFAEMGSVNPVVLFKHALLEKTPELAKMYASSITMGVGQFCTNPGILIGLKSSALNHFTSLLALELSLTNSYKMLHKGIYENYTNELDKILYEKGVETVFHAHEQENLKASAVLARVPAKEFLKNPNLKNEIFGPFSLIVVCDNIKELEEVWKSFPGQLTTSVIGTNQDIEIHQRLIKEATQFSGRIVYNSAPTGVEVSHATVHGGPFPATTDSRFTSVGGDAILRWVRPVCYQDCPEFMLAPELKNDNPLGIMRKINGLFSREAIK
ncbi:MAG: aldehyde dehydrogenase (NADP(+)) [Saprospiraceae bacterium]|nr:aldehyde dehydrogenase (NADP(+)) [Saprospiraceae bacterium]MBK8546969.1 aldehyde dehydrogenase (NADP(+)) [Saprospiraceae bacterium]MBK8853448.1 aldehyde dehydrogenase (NADP(+)) [Saprospiraceae bacterium]